MINKLWELDIEAAYRDDNGLIWEFNPQYGQEDWFCDSIMCYVGERYTWRIIKELEFTQIKVIA